MEVVSRFLLIIMILVSWLDCLMSWKISCVLRCFLKQSVSGDYILRVQIHNFSNPNNQCALCTGRCDPFNNCDNEFLFCLRPFDSVPLSTNTVNNSRQVQHLATRASNLGCLEPPPAQRSEIDSNGMLSSFTTPTFLGLPNPMDFPVTATKWEVSFSRLTRVAYLPLIQEWTMTIRVRL